MGAYQSLEQTFKRISYYQHALTLLHWDQEVMMPPGGAEERGKAIAELAALIHQNLCAASLGGWFEQAQADASLQPQQQANLREMRRVWKDSTLMPETLVREQAVVNARCQQDWNKKRPANDWRGFRKTFEPVVELAREQARVRQQALQTPTRYEALLGLYSHGDSSQLVAQVFEQLKKALPDMITAVCEKQKLTPKPEIKGEFSKSRQQELSHRVMGFLGFDFNAGRLDVSAHPFSTGNPGDQRITTRYNDKEFIEALYATVHETGHSRYEAGLPHVWRGLPAGLARNMGIHESQSLFFEKHLAGSAAFCEFVAKQANELFQLSSPLEGAFLRSSVTWVEPGYIRVVADELTYPLHIILRFEIESALINGAMEVADIPGAWNDGMQQYLGLATAGNDKDGCMQDVHWPSGAFGYFPSYTLGAVNAAQIRFAIEAELGSLNQIIEQGDITPITDWLHKHIWQHGSLLESQPLIANATGKQTEASSLLKYFESQYSL